MHKFLKQAVLSATFTSLALLAGCTGKQSAPLQPAPGAQAQTQAQAAAGRIDDDGGRG